MIAAVSLGNWSTKKWAPGSVSVRRFEHRFRHRAPMSKQWCMKPSDPHSASAGQSTVRPVSASSCSRSTVAAAR